MLARLLLSITILVCNALLANGFTVNQNRLSSVRSFHRKSQAHQQQEQVEDILCDGNTVSAARRGAVATIAAGASALMFGSTNEAFADDSYDTYEDSTYGFSLQVPSSWSKTIQELPDRRKIVFFIDQSVSNKDEQPLIFVAYTPIRDDFTSLSSFGSVDQVAQTTILPKGELMGATGVESTMIKAETQKGAYLFDYIVKAGTDQPERHLRTIFTLASKEQNAGFNLITITAQAPESVYSGTLEKTFDTMIQSFKLSK